MLARLCLCVYCFGCRLNLFISRWRTGLQVCEGRKQTGLACDEVSFKFVFIFNGRILLIFIFVELQVKWQQQDVLMEDDAFAEMAAVKVSNCD